MWGILKKGLAAIGVMETANAISNAKDAAESLEGLQDSFEQASESLEHMEDIEYLANAFDEDPAFVEQSIANFSEEIANAVDESNAIIESMDEPNTLLEYIEEDGLSGVGDYIEDSVDNIQDLIEDGFEDIGDAISDLFDWF